MRAAVPSLLLSASLFLPSPIFSRPTPATPGGELVLYRDRNFAGASLTLTHDQPDLKLSWPISSARVSGGRWQLCDQPDYGGSCLNLSSNNGDLHERRVLSARLTRLGTWRVLGDTKVNRTTWDHRMIRIDRGPVVSALRICAQDHPVRIQDARVRFTNGRSQALRVRSPIESGSCTAPFELNGSGWRLSTVEMPVSTVSADATAHLRLEGR